MSEAFVYLWYDALNKMYYLGSSIGKNPNYAHSSSVMESFTMKTKPAHMHRKILDRGTHEEMLALESELQANRKKRCWDRYYNVNVCEPFYGGYGSGENNPNWGGLSEETKKKLSKNLKQFYIDNPDKKPVGEKNGMYGKTQSELSRKKMSEAQSGSNNGFYGKTHSEEHKQKYMYGEKNPMYGKPSPFTGRNHTSENKKRASEKRKSQWSDPNSIYNTPEFRKKMSEAQSGSNNGMYGRKHSDETKRKQRDAALKREAKKRAETQGEGTLEAFLK